jgi:hypothetical protein
MAGELRLALAVVVWFGQWSDSPYPPTISLEGEQSLKSVFGHHKLTPYLRREHRVDQDKLRAHREP